ncbi:MAG: solute carrier family 23 protein, partial [Actinomycetota bacterium]
MQKKTVLGLQHVVAMFGATVLVPLLTGLNPSVALLAAGVGTLLFHLVTKRMVPVFLGSSFAFIPAIILATQRDYTWAAIGLGIMAAGVLYTAMSLIVAAVGPEAIQRIFPPIVTGPVIIVIGITLAPIAINMSEGAWWLALLTTLTAVIAAVFFKGLFRMLPILTAAVVGYILGAIFYPEFSFAAVGEAAWIGLPEFTWGFGNISWAPIALIAPIAFVTMIEHVGDIMANGNVVG